MHWLSGIVVFVMIWWTVLLCVLPWGVRRDGNVGSGAPENPKLLQKALITTGISGILWMVIYVLISSGAISFYDMAKEMEAQDLKTEQVK